MGRKSRLGHNSIIHLTSVHSPLDPRIFHKECQTLAQAGYEVIVVAVHRQDTIVNGIRIRAVPQARNRGERMTRTVWQIYRVALAEDAQLYHFHDSELLPIGLLLKLGGKRVIYDVHEDLPRQTLSRYWIPKWLRGSIAKVTELLETTAVQLFDGIVTVTPTIAKRFPEQKTILVRNFPLMNEMVVNNPPPYPQRPPLVVYVGSIGDIRGIKEMTQAMALLPKTMKVTLALGGRFADPIVETDMKQTPGWERVQFLGWQSRVEIARLLSQARVGLVILHPTASYLDSYPVKLFEYMAAGIPVIASDFPLWRQIVETAGCGLLVDPLNPKAIAEAIKYVLMHPDEAKAMGRRGREAVEKYYNWESEAAKLVQFYADLLGD